MGGLSNTCRPLVHLFSACVLAIAIAASGGATALAQPDGGSSGDNKDAEARKLYRQAEGDYAAGRYEEAAAKFTRAYELSDRAALLFNVANAYERMGEYRKAADNLRLYLKSPKVKDVVSVRERIRRLEAALEAQEKAEQAARDKAVEDTREDRKDRDNGGGSGDGGGSNSDGDGDGGGGGDRDRDRGADRSSKSDKGTARFSRQKQVYALAGTSAVGLVGTIAFGLASRAAGADAEQYCSGGGGVCLDEGKAALRSERQYAILADISLGVAVLTAGAGLWLLLRPGNKKSKPRSRTSRVVPMLLPNGLGLGVSGAL